MIFKALLRKCFSFIIQISWITGVKLFKTWNKSYLKNYFFKYWRYQISSHKIKIIDPLSLSIKFNVSGWIDQFNIIFFMNYIFKQKIITNNQFKLKYETQLLKSFSLNSKLNYSSKEKSKRSHSSKRIVERLDPSNKLKINILFLLMQSCHSRLKIRVTILFLLKQKLKKLLY